MYLFGITHLIIHFFFLWIVFVYAGIKYGRWVGDMHVTDEVQHTLLRLPVWVGMTAQEVQSVLDAVREIATSPDTPVA